MSIRIPSKIFKYDLDKAQKCWVCGEEKTGSFYEMEYRDPDGFFNDVSGEMCECCADKRGWVEEYHSEYNQSQLKIDHDAIAIAREEEWQRIKIESKHLETQRLASKRMKSRKLCAKARRKHWVDKVNQAFGTSKEVS